MSSKKGNAKNDSSDKNAQALRDIQARCPENKLCFECRQRGPTYVDTTVGSFVCSKCSGVLRGVTPPHRIKSISMSSFTTEEIESIRTRGNAYNAKVWLGLYDFKGRMSVDTKDDDSVRELIVQKYEKKRFYVDPAHVRHTVEPEPEPQKPLNGPHQSPPSKFSSGLIGSTLQFHHQNKSSSAAAKPTTATHPPAPSAVKLTPPAPEKPSAVFAFASPSVNLSKVVQGTPPVQQNADPFGAIHSKPTDSAEDFFGGKIDAFANFDAANIYTSPTSNPMTSGAGHAAPMTFAFPPIAAPVQATSVVEPKPEVKNPNPIMSSHHHQQQQQEDRYAALKDLDNIFKSSVEVTPKSNEPEPFQQHQQQQQQHQQPKPVANPAANRTYNPFSTDFSSSQQLNTSPWPISGSPSGPGFGASPAAGIGFGPKVPDFFPSPWDAPSATSKTTTDPTDFFSSKNFNNPWPESNDSENKPVPAFGQFGFNKKNPFL